MPPSFFGELMGLQPTPHTGRTRLTAANPYLQDLFSFLLGYSANDWHRSRATERQPVIAACRFYVRIA